MIWLNLRPTEVMVFNTETQKGKSLTDCVCWCKNDSEGFSRLLYPCVCLPLTSERGVVFMQIFPQSSPLPLQPPISPYLLTLSALSITLWSPASSEWSITMGSRTRRMMVHRPRWQQSPGSFFKRQRSTSEQHYGRLSEVREAQAAPLGGSNGAVKEDTQIRWHDSLNTHQERWRKKEMRGVCE